MWRLALLGLSAALLAGCGASDPVAAEEVSAAVSKTASADSFRIEIEGDEGDETVIMRGVAEQDRRRASFVYDLTSNEAGVESQHGKLVIVGNTMYMDSSLFGLSTDQTRKAMPKPWFKVENFNSEVTLDTLMFPFPFVAPGRILAAFEKVSGDVESLGEETVRGVPTSRYKLTLDLARLIETAPAERSSGPSRGARGSQDEDGAGGDLDRRGRPRAACAVRGRLGCRLDRLLRLRDRLPT